MNTVREARGLTGASDGVTGGERVRRGTPAATPAQSSKLRCRHRCHRGHPGRLSRPRTHPELRAGFQVCVSSRSKELAVRIRLSVSESSVQTQQRWENSQGLPRPSPCPPPPALLSPRPSPRLSPRPGPERQRSAAILRPCLPVCPRFSGKAVHAGQSTTSAGDIRMARGQQSVARGSRVDSGLPPVFVWSVS